jgi:hypothetical protein
MGLLEETLTKALGEYQHYGFKLSEQDDHVLILEHIPCGFKDRFNATADRLQMEAIKNDCADHLTRCEVYNKPERK